jgi:hypothetical protein
MPLFPHDRPHRFGADHRAHQVNLHNAAKAGQIHLREAAVDKDTGVVDQDVCPAPSRLDLIYHLGDLGFVRYRSGDTESLSAEVTDFGRHTIRARGTYVIDCDFCASSGKGNRMTAT